MSDNPTTPTKEDEIREALRQVIDPEIGLNVVELGLIQKIEIEKDRAHVIMILTTPFCPYAPQIMEQVRSTAQQVAGVPTTIEMGLEAWHPDMAEEGALDNWGLW
jgi:metal-sulfur cluster biosynthetic enzyme